jgi:type II secretory pathway pseudopilin PulG
MKTQIELLVVIGVIGVLGALFLPLLGRSRFVDGSVRKVESALLPEILLSRGRTNHLVIP